jgi:hypothetical protein
VNALASRCGPTCIVGPPGAGKTTIGRGVAALTHAPFHAIDEWAGVVYPPHARSQPMTDAQVDQATSMLFDAVGRAAALCEFAHHDYVALLTGDRFPAFTTSRKVIVFADIESCRARNDVRRSQVSARYIERSWSSTRDLIALCACRAPEDTIVIDTTVTSISTAVKVVAGFFNRE